MARLERSRAPQRIETENGVLGAKNRVSGAGPLKRKMRRTPPLLGDRAKKSRLIRVGISMNGGKLKYERAAAKVGKVSKHTSNVSLESP